MKALPGVLPKPRASRRPYYFGKDTTRRLPASQAIVDALFDELERLA